MNPQLPVETLDQRHDYWWQARQPLSCFFFLLPLLIIYEAGILWYGGSDPALIRNGADYWMRGFLIDAGFEYTYLLPLLISVGLLIWHQCGKYPWRVSTITLMGMSAESLLFAFCLVVLGRMQDLIFQSWIPSPSLFIEIPASSLGGASAIARMVSFVGAGVYEEVLFRLCLLPACFAIFRVFTMPAKWAAVLAVFCTSLMFAIAHYVGPSADGFSFFSFSFRLLAGLFFSALFVLRGIGITVGCHAAYDLLVGVLLVED